MILFKLWGLDFDFASLISFLIGIVAGCAADGVALCDFKV